MFGGRKPVYTPGTGQNLAFLTSGMYSKGPSFAVEDAVTLNDRPQQQIAKDCRSHHMHDAVEPLELLPRVLIGSGERCPP